MSLSPDIAVKVTNVSKVFKIYKNPSDLFWDVLSPRQRYNEFWALRDISLELKRGEVVGIIGSNGAGKSTLLKLITGNVDITSGTIETAGQVSAILELGSGFHPEYTGRENLYNGGIVAGMSKKEIESKIEDIIDFSGIRAFIDQPFKTYSSGMQARLTFSLAISREAEILILDEALAAGDAIFANKCIQRIKEICEGDTTVLFVTHSTDLVRRFCSRAIWLEQGRIVLHGDTETVTKAYDRYVYEQSEQYLRSATISASEIVEMAASGSTEAGALSPEFFKYGSKEVKIIGLETYGADGTPKRVFHPGEHMEIHIFHEGQLTDPEEVVHVGCQIFTNQGILAMTASSIADAGLAIRVGKIGVFKIVFSPLLLGQGEYLISPALYARQIEGQRWLDPLERVQGKQRWLDFHDRLCRIRVESIKHPGATYIVEHPVSWHYQEIAEAPDLDSATD
jgi:lipopolysaccharide transport system ATP-binding protein